MKNKIFLVFSLLIIFIFVNDKVKAEVDIQCFYSYENKFDTYDSFTVETYKDNGKEYINVTLMKGAKVYPKTLSFKNIVEGENSDNFLFFSGPKVYFDKTSASNLNDQKRCPQNFYYVKEDMYCFDNDGNYCNSKFGVEIVKNDVSYNYMQGNDSVMACENYAIPVKNDDEKKCYMTLNVLENGKIDVYYKDVNDKNFSKLGDVSYFFSCDNFNVYLTNNYIENPILNRGDFNNKYNNITNNGKYCPKLNYYSYGSDLYLVIEGDKLGDDYIFDGLVNGDGVKVEPNWNFEIGSDFDVKTCNDLFDYKFKKTLNGYMDWIRVLVPVCLIGLGVFDFTKAVLASKEDEMKKAQQTFIKRLIIGIAIFFVPTVVNIIIDLANIVAGGSTYGGVDCIK